MASNEIKVGVLATLLGPLAFMGEDAIRGVQLAVAEFGGNIADSPIILSVEGTNAIPESASEAADRLIKQHHVDYIIGPLSGNEGLELRDYAKTRPERTFLNGTAANQEMTLHDLAPNFFNFSPDGVQSVAGLGTYAYQMLGYRRIVVVAENYSFPRAQVGGFLTEFCKSGGNVVNRFWVPLGTSDFHEIIGWIPPTIDAIFLALVGTDIDKFLAQYAAIGGKAPMIAGTAATDQTVLACRPIQSRHMLGIVSAGPTVDENPSPAWQTFVHAYREEFPHGLPWPSLFAYTYYTNMKAALLALQTIGGDLSDSQSRFKAALSSLEFESPTGIVKLNHNRQVIANIFIKVVAEHYDGTLYTKLIKAIPCVNQTLDPIEVE